MADLQRIGPSERDIDQAITALKKGAYLLKYGRRGKPKFCPFRLSTDESSLIWYYGKEEKQLDLRQVSKLIPGQRTSIFQRYPRPEKEYQSFSLIYSDRSLDLICKDKDEAEVWILGLKALLSRSSYRKVRNDGKADSISSDSPRGRKFATFFDQGDTQQTENIPQSRLGKAFADIVAYTANDKNISQSGPGSYSVTSVSSANVDNTTSRNSTNSNTDFRISLSSAVSSSSQDSCHDDLDSLGDVFMWGEGSGDGILGGHGVTVCQPGSKPDAHLPKLLESTKVLDAYSLAFGSRHAALVTKQGEIFSWGEELGGRIGHGVEEDVSHPKRINTLSGMNMEMVACGEYHTCAVTVSGELYTWGDGIYNSGLLGHGSKIGHCIPKKVGGQMEGLHVSYVSCGTWHTALITSVGQLFTFGEGNFGALGHGDQRSTSIPKEVVVLKGMRTLRVACGVWHTAAIVDASETSSGSSFGQLFTWGDGDKDRLGHGDRESRLVPERVAALVDIGFSKVACGLNLTIGLTSSGQVYTMGSTDYGQLGSSEANGKIPICLEGKFGDSIVEEIACGSYHIAVLTSKHEVYTWGKGAHGQLGHGDKEDRHTPSLVDFLKETQVKRVVCGGNLTAVICLHKWVSSIDNTVCFNCHVPFTFRRKPHNCYNCGLVFCTACSSRKSLKASLAPSTNKPYRVCDDCYTKLQRKVEGRSVAKIPNSRSGNMLFKFNELVENIGGSSQFQTSRQSTAVSESRSSINSPKLDINDRQMFTVFSGNGHKRSITPIKTPSSISGSPKKKNSLSVPSSRAHSRAASPISGKVNPLLAMASGPSTSTHTSEMLIDAMKQRNESLSQEVIYLRAQVEELASKSRHLEGELEKKSTELEKATALAADEAENCKAAKEVIKSLTLKLNDMVEKGFEGQSPVSNFDHNNGDDTNRGSNASSTTSPASTRSESNPNSSNTTASANGSKKSSDRVVNDEPGVYVTLSPLPGGGNELKRVRFSRKRFSEQQAEKWWAENGTKVCERHNIRTTD